MRKNIFQNLKVIDLSSVLAGPSVGTFFAELGAKVVKVEHPDHPDATRFWKLRSEPKEASVSAYFSSINYLKEYVFLNLKDERDHSQLMEMVKDADVVVMNYKKGAQQKLSISDQELRQENPQLIIGKISGFGDDSDRVAYDLILQAESGFMSMNGTPESGPVKMPLAFIDVLAAHHLKHALLIEMLQKERQGKDYQGQSVSVSLYDAAITSLINQASNYLMTGKVPQRIGSLHPNIAPYGELFKTKDDKLITFAIGSNVHFEKLCKYLDLEELSNDSRFKTVQDRVENRHELQHLLAKRVRQKDTKEILDEMNNQFVPCGEIKDLKAVFEQSEAQELVRSEKIDGINTKRITSIAFKKAT